MEKSPCHAAKCPSACCDAPKIIMTPKLFEIWKRNSAELMNAETLENFHALAGLYFLGRKRTLFFIDKANNRVLIQLSKGCNYLKDNSEPTKDCSIHSDKIYPPGCKNFEFASSQCAAARKRMDLPPVK